MFQFVGVIAAFAVSCNQLDLIGALGAQSKLHSSCDLLLRLPMHGEIESLNAAVAGSIVIYLALQARQSAIQIKEG